MYAIRSYYDPDMQIYLHNIDIRTHGKDYDEYYTQAIEMGINFVRGKVGAIEKMPDDRLRVRAYDANLGQPVEINSDMVILATAIELPPEAQDLARKFGVSLDNSGFFKELHPKLKPVETAVEGVYLAGFV